VKGGRRKRHARRSSAVEHSSDPYRRAAEQSKRCADLMSVRSPTIRVPAFRSPVPAPKCSNPITGDLCVPRRCRPRATASNARSTTRRPSATTVVQKARGRAAQITHNAEAIAIRRGPRPNRARRVTLSQVSENYQKSPDVTRRAVCFGNHGIRFSAGTDKIIMDSGGGVFLSPLEPAHRRRSADGMPPMRLISWGPCRRTAIEVP